MKLRHLFFLAVLTILLAACNQTLAADVTPPPGYVPPTPVPTLGPLYPDQSPDIENGKAIYAEKCAACHGDTGLGNGPQSKDLPVSVIPIGLPEFADDAKPAEWYAVVTQGRIERFMPPFASLTDQERWDVVSYALMLQTTPEQLELGKQLFEENCADCANAFGSLEMMSALSKADIMTLIREGNGNFPAFGSGFSDEEAYAVAAYIRTLTFSAPAAPVAESATEAVAATEAATTPSAQETPTEGTPQADATEEPAAAVSTITGQIDNRSGADLPSDLTVTLRGFDHGSDPSASGGPTEFLSLETTVNPDGSYAFEAELAESQIYLTEFQLDGLRYQSEFAVVEAGMTELALAPIIVYPTTEDFSILKLEELRIYFDLASETPIVYPVYFITNPSEQTLIVSTSEGEAIPFASFPENSNGMGYETTDDSASFVSTGQENTFAMPPSEIPYGLIAFASLADANQNQIKLDIKLPTDSINIFLPEGMTAKGEGLTDTGIQNIDGSNFQVYTAVANNNTLEFTLEGKPKTTNETADLTQNQYVLIGIGALGITLILAGVWMYMRDRKKTTDEDEDDQLQEYEAESETYNDTESIMDAIIALDDLHRAGKISDEAYQKRRAELKDALKRKG